MRSIVGDRILNAGDVITIDGSSGEVFEGAIPGTTEVVPEARTLLVVGQRSSGSRSATRRERRRARREPPRRRSRR